MDYEIFLLSRIADSWHRTADNTTAVGSGLAVTGRVNWWLPGRLDRALPHLDL